MIHDVGTDAGDALPIGHRRMADPGNAHDGREVICLGIAVLDVVQRVSAPPVWGTKSVAQSLNLAAGGPATNAAVTAARLLGRATLITALGESSVAGLIREDLVRHRVEIVDIAGPGWEPPVSTCLVGPNGERTVVSVGATTSPWELTEEARRALDGDRRSSPSRRVLLLDGQHPVAAAQAIRDRPADCLAVLDAGSVKAQAEEWLAELDVVAGSADYAAGLGLSLEGAVQHVLGKGGSAAIMTDGPRPMCWAPAGGAISHVQPPHVQAVDTLGAGDAFHGALAAGLAHGLALGEAIHLSCRVASMRVAHEGARGWLSHVAPLAGATHGPSRAEGLSHQFSSQRRPV